ncbi:hypothetical protein [Frigoriglobus tundricola]|uniref:Uncharacterized protein n=1 Tax=Frigoriglobus tundricola TaxID=2774151 RepID=A0A6M5YTC9_9BACT|nr:hypothetical protein [Frigoriglobus tundricola]QJW97258.1 hypothetical protein FTUN_4828 [Frigoriglobus tundricola]
MTPTFRKQNQQLQEHAIRVLRVERPMTLRALYYRLASAGHIPATDKGYNQLKRLTKKLREGGQISITGWIVDRVRSTLKPSSWSGLADFGDTVRQAYRKDLWAQMPHHVEVFVEKDAIAGTVQPVTREYDVALNVIRGDVSISFAGEIANLWKQVQKPIFAYYLGDYDPSGFGIEDELRDKLTRYSGRAPQWTRLGVVRDDFRAFDLIALPVKSSARSAGFVAQYGTACAEVDALSPSELRDRVRRAIESHIDQERWQKLQRVKELEQQVLLDFVGEWREKTDLSTISASGEGGEE